MSHPLRRAAAIAATALVTTTALLPTAHADVATFPDVGGHITSVRVSHGPKTVGVTAFDAEVNSGTSHYRFWLDTDPGNPGPEYKNDVYPDSEFSPLQKVANFDSPGIDTRCDGYDASAGSDGPGYVKILVPRSCLGTPSSVRVSVVGYYDEDQDIVDWAPGARKFYPWVNR